MGVSPGDPGSEWAMAALAWALNVASSVSLILTNKAVMSTHAFTFATTLTGLHFAATAAAGALFSPRTTSPRPAATPADRDSEPCQAPPSGPVAPGPLPGGAEAEEAPLLPPMAGVHKGSYVAALLFPPRQGVRAGLGAWETLVFAVVADVSIASMNFSLMLNSIGFYQISKLSVLPMVCLLEASFLHKRFPLPVCGAVLLVTLGVGVATVSDFSLNLPGCMVALVAVSSTALQQVMIGALQRKHRLSSFQLLSHTSPVQALLLLLLGPACDSALSRGSLASFPLTLPALGAILLSCALAISCNLSQYMCLGSFSATSFQVLGNLKTVLVLLLGWLLYDSPLTWANMLGMGLAMLGMLLYSWLLQRGRQHARAQAPAVEGAGEKKQQ